MERLLPCCTCFSRMLQEKLDQPVSSPPSPRDINNGDMAGHLSRHIGTLRGEVGQLRNQLKQAQMEREWPNLTHWPLGDFNGILDG